MLVAAQFERDGRASRRRAHLWWATVWEAAQAITGGRFGDAQGLIDEATVTGAGPEGISAAVQVWFLRAALGRVDRRP